MEIGFIHLSAIPGRLEPSDTSEMTNQLLYGEVVAIEDSKNQWRKVRSIADGYHCWVDEKQFKSASIDLGIWRQEVKRVPGGVFYNAPHSARILPGGAFLHPLANPMHYEIPEQQGSPTDYAMRYIGAPYLWGGKTVLGIDCSGLVQVVFAAHDIWLPRDAYQQAEIGETVSFITEAKDGDLAFFDNAEGRITHVGIIVKGTNGLEIIHASGETRRDILDHQGIFRKDTGTYTHQLRIIKRIQ